MIDFDEKTCCCALNHIFGFEPRIALALISHFGSASEIFEHTTEEIDEILGPYSKHKGKIRHQVAEEAAEELYTLSTKGIHFTGWTESGYPPILKECEDAPAGLYIRSDTPIDELWTRKKFISIVGTRDISPYGHEWCERITHALSCCETHPVIVSGLAIGTDICAHKTAIESGLPTIAVMATGAEQIYPSRHKIFAERLVHTNGCALITDYPPGTPPLAIHFLRRNRIIAGLCNATILIESKAKGGGMNTARLAFSYNRDIYCLPGRIDDIRSQGCNILIKEKIAEPITTPEELIDSLGLNRANQALGEEYHTDRDIINSAIGNSMSDNDIDQMCAILLEIRQNRGVSIEELCLRTGLDYGNTSRLVSILEMEDFINIDLLQRCSINVKKV